MQKIKKISVLVLVLLFTAFTFLTYRPVYAAQKLVVPQIGFTTAPVTEYTVGDRVKFDISAQNYRGRVEYRVILWEDSKKTSHDLWDSSNGHPNRYYTKWQPNGNTTFTLGWPINEPGNYRITVYVKRVGIPNNKAFLKGLNCDSYKESVAFVVKPVVDQTAVIPGNEAGNNDSNPTNETGTNTGAGEVAEGNTGSIGNGGAGAGTGTGTSTEPLIIEAGGVVLSNGNVIAGTRVGQTNEFSIDLTGYARTIGVRTSFAVNRDCQLEIMGNKFNLSAHNPRVFGPSDFGMPDNNPPGISIGNLIDNYSNSAGYYTDVLSLVEGTNPPVTITFKIKLK